MSSSLNNLAELVLNIGEDFAITVSAVLAKPRNNALNVESTLLQKLGGQSKCVVTPRLTLLVEVIEQLAQVLGRHRNRSRELLALLFAPCLLQLFFAWVFTHGVGEAA